MNKALFNLILTVLIVAFGYALFRFGLPEELAKLNIPKLPSGQIPAGQTPKEDDIKGDVKVPEQPPVKKELFKSIAADGKGILTPGVTSEMLASSFWTDLLEEETAPVMSYNEVSLFNSEIRNKVSVVHDLTNYKEQLTKSELTAYIRQYKLPDKTMYDYSGKAFTQSFYNSLSDNTNLPAIKDTNKVRYGITVKKASIRSFPTESGAYNSSTNRTLDRFQETGCEPCEPVLILHESKDKNWYFVQMYNYRGWMKKDAVALSTSKEEVFGYADNPEFLMVTGRRVKAVPMETGSEPAVEFNMGTRLYLTRTIKTSRSASYYEIKLPLTGTDGSLQFTTAKVSGSEDVYEGYLPYSRHNVLTQAFKLQGIPYDWGDKYSGRDCSSFLMYVFRTFGINLPRNTDDQEICSGNSLKFNPQDNLQTRLKLMEELPSGSVLYMPGHTMLYLGKTNGQHFILHAFLGYNAKEGNTSKYYPVNQIAVTTVQLQNSENTPFIMKFTSALKLHN